jgi:two-component system chemotaxis response regulator CheB
MIKVLIVDDSHAAQELLAHVLNSDPAIQVVGIVSDGADAKEAVRQARPDVITMDVHMPKVGGLEATRAIMETWPTPIVIVSASSGSKEVASRFRALEAGALEVVLRPPGIGHPEHEASARKLIQTVKLMSEVKVVKRTVRSTGKSASPMSPSGPAARAAAAGQLVAIGASTGGPPALRMILAGLPQTLAAPVLIVQHIAPGFVEGFVEWLGSTSRLPLHIASNGEPALPGHAYIAPDGLHMGVGSGPRIVLSDHEPENGLRPSVAYLFRSVAQVLGPRAVGVLLTGMGKDGAVELKAMKDQGALTIAQDEASSVVYGMPGEAIKLGGATYILPPEGIAAVLVKLVRKTNRGPG